MIATLCRAVTLTQRNRITFAITKHLNFDVPGILNELLQKKICVGEVVCAHLRYRVISLGQFFGIPAKLHADTSASSSAFENHRITNVFCLGECFFYPTQHASARQQWNLLQLRKLPGVVLQPESLNLGRCRPKEFKLIGGTFRHKIGILAEEPISGMDSISRGLLGNFEQLILIEIGLTSSPCT